VGWWRHTRAIVPLPGTVGVVVPAAILIFGDDVNIGWGLDGVAAGLPVLLGLGLIAAGLAFWLWTVRLLVRIGKGTLAPEIPPGASWWGPVCQVPPGTGILALAADRNLVRHNCATATTASASPSRTSVWRSASRRPRAPPSTSIPAPWDNRVIANVAAGSGTNPAPDTSAGVRRGPHLGSQGHRQLLVAEPGGHHLPAEPPYYDEIAEPFDWRFTRADLDELMLRLATYEPQLRLVA
jgi:hypothetical protein